MSATTNSVVDRPTQRMGTVDLLLGLIAAVTNKLRAKGEEDKVSIGLLCNALHEMQCDPRFADELAYLDFDRVGNNWISRTLEDFLFQAGTWGMHKVPNPAVATITLDPTRANRRLQVLQNDHGPDAIGKLDAMAQEFVLIAERLRTDE